MSEIVLVIVFTVLLITTYLSNKITRRKIFNLNKRLTEFEKEFYKNIYEQDLWLSDYRGEAIEYVQLELMPRRLDKLRFCYQCPLYRDKAQEDKRQNFLQHNKQSK